jgi:methionyl-tRNA formyltransferase
MSDHPMNRSPDDPITRLVFCGTPPFAVPTLERLVDAGFAISLVVTQPDKPHGRGLELSPSPVKERALQLGLAVTQPEKIKNNEQLRSQLAGLNPDAIVVVGYGRIIPQWMIDLPPLGNINLHASLLPKYRGAAPIQWAIACGEPVTGVTTMRIDAGLDTGDILLQREIPVAPDDTAVTIAPRMATVGADLMVETLQTLRAGSITPRPQEESQASLAPLLKKEDGHLNFTRPAIEICNRLRGFQPWPGGFTSFRGKNLHVWAATPTTARVAPATIAVEGSRLLVGAGESTAIEVLEVQPEGKKRMPARDFIHGYHPQRGEKLGAD